MAPTIIMKRDRWVCDDDASNCYLVSDRWYDYGRWLAAAGLLVSFFLLLLLCACMSARRRRKMGAEPFYGTTWLAPKPPAYAVDPHGNEYGGYYSAPAPPYTPNPNYASQQTGVTDNNTTPQFPPPPGPPPQGQSYELHNVAPPAPTHPPVHVQQTGSSMQSNNPYLQPTDGSTPTHMSGAK